MGCIPTDGMLCSAGLAALFTLGLLAKRVVSAPAPTPRSDASVSFSSHRYLVTPSECLADFLGRLRGLRGEFHRSQLTMRISRSTDGLSRQLRW